MAAPPRPSSGHVGRIRHRNFAQSCHADDRNPGKPVRRAKRSPGSVQITSAEFVHCHTARVSPAEVGRKMTQMHQRSVGDRYELLSELGRNAGRGVWRARDRVTGSEVAVKVLRPELIAGPETLDELRHTLDLIRQLGHPGILAVSEVAMFGDRVALVGELLSGES